MHELARSLLSFGAMKLALSLVPVEGRRHSRMTELSQREETLVEDPVIRLRMLTQVMIERSDDPPVQSPRADCGSLARLLHLTQLAHTYCFPH